MTTASQSDNAASQGPLQGLRVVEFLGLGPAPFAAMILADLGATVVRISRPGIGFDTRDVTARGRRYLELDLKKPADIDAALALLDRSDVLIEGFRPEVMERLGLGPEVVQKRNPRIVYGRMTGWGQAGPLARSAGHDINYIAITGALAAIGEAGGKPVPPLNLVGDYAGGSLYLLIGILSALFESRRSGQGQVIDCAICDGVVNLLSFFHTFAAQGAWNDRKPGTNLLDGGAHFYGTYECADGRFLSIGSIEPKFYDLLRKLTGLSDPAFDAQNDVSAWPDLKARTAAIIRTKTMQEWCDLMEETDACVAGIRTLSEASRHPHLAARESFVEVDGLLQSAPAPRFSRTPGAVSPTRTDRISQVTEILDLWKEPRG